VEQVEDRSDPEPPHLAHHEVRELPIVFARAEEGFVNGETVAEHEQAELAGQGQILAPAVVMAALREQVAAGAAIVDGRI
jgi:hypothetical protein